MAVGRRIFGFGVVGAFMAIAHGASMAAPIDARADAIVKQMRQGGLVLVFRHTVAQMQAPNAGETLSEQGEKQANALGLMLRDLHIPTGDTYTSTRKRAVDTARLANFGKVTALDVLSDTDAQLARTDSDDRAEAFRALLRERPERGVNLVMVADKVSMTRAIGSSVANVQEGELVVIRPDARIDRGFDVAGRLTLRELRDYWRASGHDYPALRSVRW